MEEKLSTSKVKRTAGSYTFRIEGYGGLSTRIGDSTESPEFELCEHTWQLRIFPGGSLDNHRGFMSFYLASKSTRIARASYKLAVINQIAGKSDEVFSSSGVRIFEAKGVQIDGWGRDKFMTIASLMNPDLGYYYNDTVVFKMELVVFSDIEHEESTITTRNLTTLQSSMKLLLADEESSDVEIVFGSATNLKLTAHRCILKARSPVFRAMLNTPMRESLSGIILVEDIDYYTMKEALCFMYTDTFTSENTLSVMAELLLCVGTKYEILGLLSRCEDHLIQQLSLETAVSLLKLSDTYNASRLKAKTLAFIAKNGATIMQTKEFFELTYELAKESTAAMDAVSRRAGCGHDCGDKKLSSSCLLS